MKTIIAVFLFAMVVGAMCQSYNYGYNTYTPGARVSHYASSSGSGVPVVAPVAHHPYAYNYGNYAPYGVAGAGAYPYRWY